LPVCAQSKATKPDCKSFYLIPGKANDCTKPTSKKFISIDANSVSVTPSPIKLPGCFTLSMKVTIEPTDVPKSFFSKVEYDWGNVPQVRSLPCQNASANGCGGFGNNCFYCDVCNSLQDVDKTDSKSSLVTQFKQIKCPDKAGPYTFTREFCFNDLSELDKDHNCKLDFLENGQTGESYQDALKNLQKAGFGTVLAKFILAYNATSDQQEKKRAKEAELEKSIDADVEKQRAKNNWAVTDQEFITFRNWYIDYKKNTWHKNEYLPWLLYYNEIGCMTVSFDVCDKPPVPAASGANAFQCPSS